MLSVQHGRWLKGNAILRWSWLASILLLSGPSMAPLLRTSAQVPQSNLILLDAFGTESAGVYLGHGLVLASWQSVVGERYLWDVDTQRAPALAIQVPTVPVQLLDDPLDGFICEDDVGFAYQLSSENSQCHSYNLARGMSVSVEGYSASVPIQDLLYADRELDIALLSVDEVGIQVFDLQPVPLSAYILQAADTLVLLDNAIAQVVDQNMTIRNQPTHGIFDGSQQQTRVIQVALANDAQPLVGTPFYDEYGVAGLYWGRDVDADFITPTALWYHDLWQANDTLQNEALATVLETAAIPDKVAGAPYVDLAFSPELGNTGYDVLHYDLNLAIDPTDLSLNGIARLSMTATSHRLAAFTLDFSVMQAQSVMVNGEPVLFSQLNGKLEINLNAPVDYGTPFEVQVVYAGIARAVDTPYSNFFRVGLEHESDPPRMAFANQPDGAHTWYPCNDFPTDRATYAFHITVPTGYMAVANGYLTETIVDEAGTTFDWQMDFPMATNLSIVAIADYARIDEIASNGVALQHYAYAGTAGQITEILGTTDTAFRILEPLFGDYPFETYGHVVTPLTDGAIETQTMTMLPTDTAYGTPDSFFDLVVHELAHHWYGNSVTLASWQDIWLNEGFATLAEWLAIEAQDGPEALREVLSRDENALSTSRRSTPLAYPNQTEIFSRDSYIKGAWVLHMLRLRLGDDVFFPMIQAWAQVDTPITTNDFFRFAEQFSGQDLTVFRRQWLQSRGIPMYTIAWQYQDHVLTIRACNQRDVPYVLDLVLQVTTIDGTRLAEQFTLQDNASYSLPLDGLPTDLAIDPDQTVLGIFDTQHVSDISSCLFLIE